MRPVRVVIVEDSPLMRSILASAISEIPNFEIVGTAQNAATALEKVRAEEPDLVTLDVELPDMNGLELLKRIMESHAPAVVMISGLTQSCAQTTLRALQLGAVDYIGKYDTKTGHDRDAWLEELVQKLKRAANTRPLNFRQQAPTKTAGNARPATTRTRSSRELVETVIVVGVGPSAADMLNRLVVQLPTDCPPVVVALQQSPIVIETLTAMLRRRAIVDIKIAVEGELLKPGRVYFGPGDVHLGLAARGAERNVRLIPGEPIHGHLPCIDFLFEAAAHQLGANAVGILLEPVGDDGEAGLRMLASKQARVMRHTRDASKSGDVRAAFGRWDEIPVLGLEQLIQLLFS